MKKILFILTLGFAFYRCTEDKIEPLRTLTIWYEDADSDGYGNPEKSKETETKPNGYVENDTDCDDKNPDAHKVTIWYEDKDNDGLGNPNVSKESCGKPEGYVANKDDEDDSGLTTYYEDADGDGYGNPEKSKQAETKPDGYVENNTDCDDTNPDAHEATTWYEDKDGDGLGNPNVSKDNCGKPEGYVANKDDEDDSGLTTYYEDADGDGYGNPEKSKQAETKPDGYVENDTDCDDKNPDAHKVTIWYEDKDNDGLGNPNVSKESCGKPDGYVENKDDDDDDVKSQLFKDFEQYFFDEVWIGEFQSSGFFIANKELMKVATGNGDHDNLTQHNLEIKDERERITLISDGFTPGTPGGIGSKTDTIYLTEITENKLKVTINDNSSLFMKRPKVFDKIFNAKWLIGKGLYPEPLVFSDSMKIINHYSAFNKPLNFLGTLGFGKNLYGGNNLNEVNFFKLVINEEKLATYSASPSEVSTVTHLFNFDSFSIENDSFCSGDYCFKVIPE